MNDIKAAVAAIQNAFDYEVYPAGFLEKYDQMERMAASHGTETFLVQQKSSNRLYVAKCYDKNLYSTVHESSILKSLSHSGLPAFSDEFQNDCIVCIVREYVVGRPLDQYKSESNFIKKDVIGICVQLCDILIYLHEQKQPVIHRDIKPQNIIMKPDGAISLIDFDISRIYHADAKTDTQFIGTREYAPPEQYGFSQTDCRTDIYSVGVLFGWLLTGETDAKKVMQTLGDSELLDIYKKCTAFSPESRFASAQKLKFTLLHVGGERKKKALLWMTAILSCLIFLYAGFSIGRYTDFLSTVLEPYADVVFKEPMIEQAVRLQVGKKTDEPISQEDLLSVTGLYIFGDSLVAANEKDLHAEAMRLFESNQMKEGTISSLADLSKMPNLKQVFLSMQRIADISPLADLQNLEIVDLKNNPITDISPLSELKFLKSVSLFDTRVKDLSPLSGCPMLSELNAGKLPFPSLTPFEDLKGLKHLSLYETTLDSLTGIDQLKQLTFFEVSGIIDGDLMPLLSLPQLKEVILDESMRLAAEAITDRAAFTITYR
ncbi:MAG: protein kinase [Eubacteriales bacterium]|nr:protein kinase [Eubacteriales bacterium]